MAGVEQPEEDQAISDINGFGKKRRASMEDFTEAMTERFGGAAGMMEIYHKLMFSSDTSGATKAKLLMKMGDVIAATTKQYGDRERLAGMNTKHIKARLFELLQEHGFVVPIEGINLHAPGSTPEEEAKGGQGSPGLAGPEDEDRGIEEDGTQFTGDMDG